MTHITTGGEVLPNPKTRLEGEAATAHVREPSSPNPNTIDGEHRNAPPQVGVSGEFANPFVRVCRVKDLKELTGLLSDFAFLASLDTAPSMSRHRVQQLFYEYKLGTQLDCALKSLATAHATGLTTAQSGWIEVGGRWLYAHAAGAIGPRTPSGYLDGLLARVTLPAVPFNPLVAVQWCLFIERVAVPRTSLPLMAAMFRAPTLDFHPFEGSLALVGPPGARKRALALVASSPWGLSNCDDTFPWIWATEALHLAKDMLVVVEGNVPDADPGDRDGGQARRLTRAEWLEWLNLPRPGLLLSVAEDIDLAAAVHAGTLVLAVGHHDVDDAALTLLQNARSSLAAGMSAYIAWLSRRAHALRHDLPQRHTAWLRYFLPRVPHPGIAFTAAHLMPGAELLGQFAREVGALDDRAQVEFVDRVRAALLDCIDWQLPR